MRPQKIRKVQRRDWKLVQSTFSVADETLKGELKLNLIFVKKCRDVHYSPIIFLISRLMFQENHSQEKREEIKALKKQVQQPKITDKTTNISSQPNFEIIDEGTHNNQEQTSEDLIKSLIMYWYPKAGVTPEKIEELRKAIESADPKMNLWGLKGLNLFVSFNRNFYEIVMQIDMNLMKSIFSIVKQCEFQCLKEEAFLFIKITPSNERLLTYSLELGALSMCLEIIKDRGNEADTKQIQLLNVLANKTKESRAEFYSNGGLDCLVDLYLKSNNQWQRDVGFQFFKTLIYVSEEEGIFSQQLKTKEHLSSLCRLFRELESDQAKLEDILLKLFYYYDQRHQEIRQIFAQQYIIDILIKRIKVFLLKNNYNLNVEEDILKQIWFIEGLIYKSTAQIDIVLKSKIFDYLQQLITRNPNLYFEGLRSLIVTMFTGNSVQISQMLTKTRSLDFVTSFEESDTKSISKYVFQMVKYILGQVQPQEVLKLIYKFKIITFLEKNLFFHIVSEYNVDYVEQTLVVILHIFQSAQNQEVFKKIDSFLTLQKTNKEMRYDYSSQTLISHNKRVSSQNDEVILTYLFIISILYQTKHQFQILTYISFLFNQSLNQIISFHSEGQNSLIFR